MTQKTGTKAERENADRLIAEGHTVLFFSTTSPCDLLDVCCHTLVEVKTTKFKTKKLSGRERDQLSRLLTMKDHMPIRYDIKFIRFDGLHSLWQSFFPTKMASSFRPEGNYTMPPSDGSKTVLKSRENKKKEDINYTTCSPSQRVRQECHPGADNAKPGKHKRRQ